MLPEGCHTAHERRRPSAFAVSFSRERQIAEFSCAASVFSSSSERLGIITHGTLSVYAAHSDYKLKPEFRGVWVPRFVDPMLETKYQNSRLPRIAKEGLHKLWFLACFVLVSAPVFAFAFREEDRWLYLLGSCLASCTCGSYALFLAYWRRKLARCYNHIVFAIGLLCQVLAGLTHNFLFIILSDGVMWKGEARDGLLQFLDVCIACVSLSAGGFLIQRVFLFTSVLMVLSIAINITLGFVYRQSDPADAFASIASLAVVNVEILLIGVVIGALHRKRNLQDRRDFQSQHHTEMMQTLRQTQERVQSIMRNEMEVEEKANEALIRTSQHRELVRGDRVRVIKEARTKGKTAIVMQPKWNGLVKVNMEEPDVKGKVKSYERSDLELIVPADFGVGDRVKITKETRLKGRIGVVVDPQWNGLVKIRLEEPDAKGLMKSYLPSHLEIEEKKQRSHSSLKINPIAKPRVLQAPPPSQHLQEKGLAPPRKTAMAGRENSGDSSPNQLLVATMKNQQADWTRIRQMATRIKDDKYTLEQFFDDCIMSFPELQLFFLLESAAGADVTASANFANLKKLTSSGRASEAEYQRTIGALFAVYWLLRLDTDGRNGFCMGVDDDWNIQDLPDTDGIYPTLSGSSEPTSNSLALFGRPWSQLTPDEKRYSFHCCTDWSLMSRLVVQAGCAGPGSTVERIMALLCLTAFHDIMKVEDLLPTVSERHAPYLGYAAGIQIRDHDIAISYVMEHFPELLPSFVGLPVKEKEVLMFTQGKMQFNHGWFVQAEAPPGYMLKTFKEELRVGASARDISFYFLHWFTDLAGAEPTPLGGAEKFVLKFPHAILAAFLWSMPFLENLATKQETEVFESYLAARWRSIVPDKPVPCDHTAVACMRLAVMAQGDYSVVQAYYELHPNDQQLLIHELSRTGAEDQQFSVFAVGVGGPALLVYYAPALLQRNVGAYDDLCHALRVLCQVLRAGRVLWPCSEEQQGNTVTIQVAELKATDIRDVVGMVLPKPGDSQKIWVMVRHNDCEASVEAKTAGEVNALFHSKAAFRVLDFYPTIDAVVQPNDCADSDSLEMAASMLAAASRTSAPKTSATPIFCTL